MITSANWSSNTALTRVFFGGEPAIEGGHADPGTLRDFVKLHLDAPLGEGHPRGLDDAFGVAGCINSQACSGMSQGNYRQLDPSGM